MTRIPPSKQKLLCETENCSSHGTAPFVPEMWDMISGTGDSPFKPEAGIQIEIKNKKMTEYDLNKSHANKFFTKKNIAIIELFLPLHVKFKELYTLN
jgi:hypothetical protein